MSKRKYIYIILSVILLIIAIIMPRLNITVTDSLDKHVYFQVNKPNIERGDYVSFNLPFLPYSSIRQHIGKLTTKKVMCTPGDELLIQNEYAYCNGKLVSVAKKISLKGERLIPFVYNGKIPEGNYYVVGDNPNSLDSRYFGFIKREEIKGVYMALF